MIKPRQAAHTVVVKSNISIRAVAEETGISIHTLRAWERRYGALVPERTGTNRRVYDREDVARLKMLHRAVESGHSIGLIADLPTDDLRKLVSAEPSAVVGSQRSEQIFDECCRALHILDAEALNSAIQRASLLLGVDRFLSELVLPLIAFVDQEWSLGRLSIAQEHLVSALLRTHLEQTRLKIQPMLSAPRVVVGTLSGQHHELGAMLVAIVAARCNWNVTYLGCDLPAQEIAQAARRSGASIVALSLVYPAGDSSLEADILSLGKHLKSGIRVIAGGMAAQSYSRALESVGATICQSLDDLRQALETPADQPSNR